MHLVRMNAILRLSRNRLSMISLCTQAHQAQQQLGQVHSRWLAEGPSSLTLPCEAPPHAHSSREA